MISHLTVYRYFLPLLGCLFTLFNALLYIKLLVWCDLIFHFLFLMHMLLQSYPNVYPMMFWNFSSHNSIVLGLTFMSLIHIELIFVYSKSWEFSSSVYGQSTLPSTIYQRISFLQCVSSLSKKCVYKCMFLILGSLVCSFGLFNVHVHMYSVVWGYYHFVDFEVRYYNTVSFVLFT